MNRRELFRTFAAAGITARLARAARLTRDNVCFITDEVSRDLSVALQFAAEFGVRQVEFRNVYGMYCFRHDNEKLKQIHAQLKEHGVRLAILDTPVLKCVLPGSQLLKSVEKPIQDAQKDLPVPVEEQFAQQAEYTRKAIEAARILETDKIRIFSYWRVADREKERPRILEGLQRVTEMAEKAKVKLCIENEGACNIANCAEAASVVKEIRSPYLGVNWDIVNGSSTGETPFPDGFNKLDKSRIWHVHVKDMMVDPETKRRRVCAVGDGTIPYHDILPALAKAGYTGALSMETHFSINGSREPASRRSMQGLLKVISELA